MESKFEVIQTETRGKIVVTKCNISKGTILLEEDPILLIPIDEIKSLPKGENDSLNIFLLIYQKFLKISPKLKELYLNLFGQFGLVDIKNFREIFANYIESSEFDTFIKVIAVYKFNVFFDYNKNQCVYNILTRISHSCDPNCYLKLYGSRQECCTIKDISIGEELTISYNNERNIKPTYERRRQYLKYKEFLCECSRCIAIGDDTRQFNCEYCNGIQMIHQPLEDFPPEFTKCSICKKISSKEYLNKMLKLEQKLPKLTLQFENEFKEILKTLNPHIVLNNLKKLFESIESIKYPVKHVLSREILKIQMNITIGIMKLDSSNLTRNKEICQKFCILYYDNLEIVKNICNKTINEFFNISSELILWNPNKEDYILAQQCCQKSLQMQKLLNREDKNKFYIQMNVILENLNPKDSVGCIFCGDINSKSKCSVCKNVTYCGR